ncbi:hypothetical protein K7432_013295 [Basidiobolus ranarum]|uniref:Sugar phosphate transporter domain-containing protein n=1 Tax=Basidiobolus ranarum TaxID=34480 RepID=A0ABR2VR56_9FUNG
MTPQNRDYIQLTVVDDTSKDKNFSGRSTPLPSKLNPLSEPSSTSDFLTPISICINVCSSVGIVLCNKFVFDKYDFKFGTALTVIHFLVTFLGLEVCARLGFFEKKTIRIKEVLGLCVSFCGFVVLTNLSLQHNTVGFYQMAKVLTTPCIAILQTVFYQKTFSTSIKLSLAVICFGVGIASVTDVSLNWVGTFFALAGVLVTSLYQIWIGTKQKSLGVNSWQLLYYQAPISSLMLLCVVPIIDDLPGLMNYSYNIQNVSAILFTGLLAFLVNLSIFMIIGKTSPITYNVVGHFKTCLILVLGFFIFNYPVDIINISGIIIALIGIFSYSKYTMKNPK